MNLKSSLITINWSRPPHSLSLPNEEGHVWLLRLDQIKLPLDRFRKILSDEERFRSRRFHNKSDQISYIWRHAVLRLILSRYVRIKPAEIPIATSNLGKPFLVNNKKNNIELNISFSEDLTIFAFSCKHRIGIDIERIRDFLELKLIAKTYFTSNESERLSQAPLDKKLEVFFKIWTQKEAYAKALGEGLSYNQPSLISASSVEESDNKWFFKSFIPAQNYMATLALEGPVNDLCFWKWSFE